MIPSPGRYDKEERKEGRECGNIGHKSMLILEYMAFENGASVQTTWVRILYCTWHVSAKSWHQSLTSARRYRQYHTRPELILLSHWAKPGTLALCVSWLRCPPSVTAKVSAIIGREEGFNMFMGIGADLNSLTPAWKTINIPYLNTSHSSISTFFSLSQKIRNWAFHYQRKYTWEFWPFFAAGIRNKLLS